MVFPHQTYSIGSGYEIPSDRSQRIQAAWSPWRGLRHVRWLSCREGGVFM